MTSFVDEQWPDTVLPPSAGTVDAGNVTALTLEVAPQHLFHAWAQISVELAKVNCNVLCKFKNQCIKKTLLYGARVMPLRIGEMVRTSRIRGLMRHAEDALDFVCASEDENYHCATGWRASPSQVAELDIRTPTGCLRLVTVPSDSSSTAWFALDTANELSCWLWSVSSKENVRPVNRIDIGCLLSDKMKTILK